MTLISNITMLVIELLVTLGVVFGFQLIADYYTTKYSNEVVWIGNMNWQMKLSAIIYFSIVGISLSIIEHLYFYNTMELINLRIMAVLLMVIFLGTPIATVVLVVASTAYFLFWGIHTYIIIYSALYIGLFIVISMINHSKRLSFLSQYGLFCIVAMLFWMGTYLYKNEAAGGGMSVAALITHILEMVFLCGAPILMIRLLEQNQLMISEQTLGAYIDELTQLYNYHSFSLNFERAFQKAQQIRKPLSLMIMDLDGFKQVNDTYGHLAGNHVLRGFSKMLANVSEANIVAYRIGGEEMALVFNGIEAKQATVVANQLLETLQQHEFHYEGSHIKLTFSAGLSQIKVTDETSRDFFRRSDHLTYTAKRAGGNRVAVVTD